MLDIEDLSVSEVIDIIMENPTYLEKLLSWLTINA